jgi:hypothetical protein
MRYAILAYIICLQRISFRVKKRFTSLQHHVESVSVSSSDERVFMVVFINFAVMTCGEVPNRVSILKVIHIKQCDCIHLIIQS